MHRDIAVANSAHARRGHSVRGRPGRRCTGGLTTPRYAPLIAVEFVVREARIGDARAIAQVSVASRRWSYRNLLPESDLKALSVEEVTAVFARWLAEPIPGSVVFVAELTGRVVGYALVETSRDPVVPAATSELGDLHITEEVAGTGVAGVLLERAFGHARAAGHAFLTLWVRRENARARRFYEKHGLQPDGAERFGPHPVLPIEINEIRYRVSLESRS